MAKAKNTKENIKWWIGTLSSLAVLLIFLNLQAINSNLLALDVKWLLVASIPLLITLVRSNIIQKFKGFGIELETRLQNPISSINLVAVAALLDLPGDAKQSVNYLERLSPNKRESIQRLTFQIERSGYYDEGAIRFYLRELPNVSFFEVVDSSRKFLALLPVDQLVDRNNPNEEVLRVFVKALEANYAQAVFSQIAITKTISESDNILDALQQVRKSKFGYLPVISEDGYFLGIATKPILESKVADEVLLTEGK
jgi:CBS domain-containing protein